jgi:hypothetical protein
MRLFERIKAAMRRWLGIDDLATKRLIAGLEQAERDRHSEVMAALNRIEQLSKVVHQNPADRTFNPGVLDWETVQAIALHDLEKEQG